MPQPVCQRITQLGSLPQRWFQVSVRTFSVKQWWQMWQKLANSWWECPIAVIGSVNYQSGWHLRAIKECVFLKIHCFAVNVFASIITHRCTPWPTPQNLLPSVFLGLRLCLLSRGQYGISLINLSIFQWRTILLVIAFISILLNFNNLLIQSLALWHPLVVPDASRQRFVGTARTWRGWKKPLHGRAYHPFKYNNARNVWSPAV